MQRLALALFALLGVSLIVGGVLYLVTDRFMPYHAAALQTEWDALEPNLQGLILGLIKGLGAGSLVTGCATLYMVIGALRGKLRPYRRLLPIVATGYSALLCYATWTVYTSTPAKPPLLLTIAYVVIAVFASTILNVQRTVPSDART